MRTNTEKLNELKSRLDSNTFETILSRVNSLYKVASKVPFLNSPTLGVITGLDFISTSIDEILNNLESIDNSEYKHVALELLEDHEAKLIGLQQKVTELVPIVSVTLLNPESAIINIEHSHGIASVTDNGTNNFTINFISALRMPDMYFPHCNVPTKYIRVQKHGMDVVFVQGTSENTEVKIYLDWMGTYSPN